MKTETKHTPGPWKVSGCCQVRQNVVGEWIHEAMVTVADDFALSPCVATIDCKRYRETETKAMRPDAECLANARLIAAAPELLEALEALLADCLTLKPPFRNEALREQAQAAIAKATKQCKGRGSNDSARRYRETCKRGR